MKLYIIVFAECLAEQLLPSRQQPQACGPDVEAAREPGDRREDLLVESFSP